MNMDLIKQIVSYIDEHKPEGMKFAYNMTTNAMLLRVYQDFWLSISFIFWLVWMVLKLMTAIG